MEVLGRNKLNPIHLCAGDTLCVTHKDENVETVLCETTINASHAMTVDEAVLFADVFEGRRALGGMVLEKVK